MLTTRFTRTTPTHHKLEYRREDGTGEVMELETRSYLMHDFIHLAIESEARLKTGFYGSLAGGKSYGDLSNKTDMGGYSKEALDIERAAGVFTVLVKGETEIRDVLAGLENIYSAYDESLPAWLSEDMLGRALLRYRSIVGAWGSLKFGETLELHFP